ncbi:septation protein SepH [Planomonospora corallina]|uniref:Septation protein SepH n=1 Tax=Planomonospora corallina TaxID=1806052 RepID=A0ABV8IJE3_9ACTN
MQELRLVAVSEDGTYLVLATAGRGTRFTLPVDDRLRAAVRGNFSRLGQYEIEVESPLRPKEIQARIRAGETAEEIAATAGIPVERVRWFEGPVLQEREYMAQQAQRCAVRLPDATAPGPTLGELVTERLTRRGVPADEIDWDSAKREDNLWRIRLGFVWNGHTRRAEWLFDPRRRHITPHDDEARRLSASEYVEPAEDTTVTPFVPRVVTKLAPVPPPAPEPAFESAPRSAPQPAERPPVPFPSVLRPEAGALPAGDSVPEAPEAPEAGPVPAGFPASLSSSPSSPAGPPAAPVLPAESSAPPVLPAPPVSPVLPASPAAQAPAEPSGDAYVRPPMPPLPEGFEAPPVPAVPPLRAPGSPVPEPIRPAVPSGPAARAPREETSEDRKTGPGGSSPTGPAAAIGPAAAAGTGAREHTAAEEAEEAGAPESPAGQRDGGEKPRETAPGAAQEDGAEAPIAVPAARLSADRPGRTPAEPVRETGRKDPEPVQRSVPDKPADKGPADKPADKPADPPKPAPAPAPARPAKRGRGRRASVPTWDEIMFGARRPD